MLPHPLDPRCSLDNELSLHTCTYTTYLKGILGLSGGNRVVQAKEGIKHLTNLVVLQIYKIDRDRPRFMCQYLMSVTKIASTVDDQNQFSFKTKQIYCYRK